MLSIESGELGDQYNQSEPSTQVKAPGRRRRRRAATLPSSLHFLVFRCGRWQRARSSRSELRFPTWMWFYFPLSLSSILWRADSQPRRRFVVGAKRSLRRDEGQQLFKASPVVLGRVYSQMNYRLRLQLKIRILCKQLTFRGGNKRPVSSRYVC